MTTIDWSEGTSTSRDELPRTTTTYLDAHLRRDVAVAIATLTPDATVTDEGHTYRGHDEIRDWLGRAGSEFTYTTEFVGATTIDASHVDVLHRIEGDFPGGVADLHYRFTLDGDAISGLIIEP
ncbi:nuclear transport factor 2 family protein [Mycolicibacterium sp. GCM10028919]|uniref:nuclear transport factor 2 family protein n=1 Tax=Mycolicibacterium sp. GCM10028919 TaxID=3273401 RepID=UPI00361C3094